MKYSIKNLYIIQSQEPSLQSMLKGMAKQSTEPQSLATLSFWLLHESSVNDFCTLYFHTEKKQLY
jgi:hypothetical protein